MPMAYTLNPNKGKDHLYVHIVGDDCIRIKSEIVKIVENGKETDQREIQWKDDSISDLIDYFGKNIPLPKLTKTLQRIKKEVGGVDKADVKFEIDGDSALFKIENAPK